MRMSKAQSPITGNSQSKEDDMQSSPHKALRKGVDTGSASPGRSEEEAPLRRHA